MMLASVFVGMIMGLAAGVAGYAVFGVPLLAALGLYALFGALGILLPAIALARAGVRARDLRRAQFPA